MTSSSAGRRPSGSESKPRELLQSDPALEQLATALDGDTLLALDTEAASFHRYETRICLLQLSTRSRTAIIDPLAISRLDPLAGYLVDPGVEVVFHDADFDLRLLDREYGIRINRIFDTRIAAQLLNEPGIGLAALLEKHLDVRLDKRFQRADWSRRPLPQEMLEYAATDTEYLPPLRDVMRNALERAGRLAWAEEEFHLLEEIRWVEPEPDGFWRLKGARQLKGPAPAVLKELYEWRDALARQLDRAPFRVMNNEAMMALAQSQPATIDKLQEIRGIGSESVQRRGKDILAAIERGLRTPADRIPRLERVRGRAPDPAYFERLDRLKAIRNEVAQRVNLAPGVLCPNGTLEAVARTAPATREELRAVPGLRRWQDEVIGEEMLQGLRAED
ncbi:MAG: ribonuclease D [Gemmatimonadales bacterium]